MINSKLKSPFFVPGVPPVPAPNFSPQTLCLLGTGGAGNAGEVLPGDLISNRHCLGGKPLVKY